MNHFNGTGQRPINADQERDEENETLYQELASEYENEDTDDEELHHSVYMEDIRGKCNGHCCYKGVGFYHCNKCLLYRSSLQRFASNTVFYNERPRRNSRIPQLDNNRYDTPHETITYAEYPVNNVEQINRSRVHSQSSEIEVAPNSATVRNTILPVPYESPNQHPEIRYAIPVTQSNAVADHVRRYHYIPQYIPNCCERNSQYVCPDNMVPQESIYAADYSHAYIPASQYRTVSAEQLTEFSQQQQIEPTEHNQTTAEELTEEVPRPRQTLSATAPVFIPRQAPLPRPIIFYPAPAQSYYNVPHQHVNHSHYRSANPNLFVPMPPYVRNPTPYYAPTYLAPQQQQQPQPPPQPQPQPQPQSQQPPNASAKKPTSGLGRGPTGTRRERRVCHYCSETFIEILSDNNEDDTTNVVNPAPKDKPHICKPQNPSIDKISTISSILNGLDAASINLESDIRPSSSSAKVDKPLVEKTIDLDLQPSSILNGLDAASINLESDIGPSSSSTKVDKPLVDKTIDIDLQPSTSKGNKSLAKQNDAEGAANMLSISKDTKSIIDYLHSEFKKKLADYPSDSSDEDIQLLFRTATTNMDLMLDKIDSAKSSKSDKSGEKSIETSKAKMSLVEDEDNKKKPNFEAPSTSSNTVGIVISAQNVDSIKTDLTINESEALSDFKMFALCKQNTDNDNQMQSITKRQMKNLRKRQNRAERNSINQSLKKREEELKVTVLQHLIGCKTVGREKIQQAPSTSTNVKKNLNADQPCTTTSTCSQSESSANTNLQTSRIKSDSKQPQITKNNIQTQSVCSNVKNKVISGQTKDIKTTVQTQSTHSKGNDNVVAGHSKHNKATVQMQTTRSKGTGNLSASSQLLDNKNNVQIQSVQSKSDKMPGEPKNIKNSDQTQSKRTKGDKKLMSGPIKLIKTTHETQATCLKSNNKSAASEPVVKTADVTKSIRSKDNKKLTSKQPDGPKNTDRAQPTHSEGSNKSHTVTGQSHNVKTAVVTKFNRSTSIVNDNLIAHQPLGGDSEKNIQTQSIYSKGDKNISESNCVIANASISTPNAHGTDIEVPKLDELSILTTEFNLHPIKFHKTISDFQKTWQSHSVDVSCQHIQTIDPQTNLVTNIGDIGGTEVQDITRSEAIIMPTKTFKVKHFILQPEGHTGMTMSDNEIEDLLREVNNNLSTFKLYSYEPSADGKSESDKDALTSPDPNNNATSTLPDPNNNAEIVNSNLKPSFVCTMISDKNLYLKNMTPLAVIKADPNLLKQTSTSVEVLRQIFNWDELSVQALAIKGETIIVYNENREELTSIPPANTTKVCTENPITNVRGEGKNDACIQTDVKELMMKANKKEVVDKIGKANDNTNKMTKIDTQQEVSKNNSYNANMRETDSSYADTDTKLNLSSKVKHPPNKKT
ncbi:uncharacterized protein LOC119662588 [Teleopsis dalmanni]|uniref:uncharacterized protein LOC119662588 n=1 Tax=Teleopsis dalmanni TaxID=139649 RepID=UPI0018CF4396|nr:uncharacterized protein LOC119662588 [Teleopsis dalmanni]XP_037928165.1 uncharacterized protein LOC119662588 [Teleopsis dalmanni]XP_037928166.1 uncharacterized protein LOC119662588 [Teleopsis dalmanni]XP_037928167.1 uncharacterized protein LOC119662588 [Teleopsis dalmanni]